MTLMAEQPATGGRYLHAANQKDLLDYFEKLAFKINEQGIDATLCGRSPPSRRARTATPGTSPVCR